MAQNGKKRSILARMARFFAVREQGGEAFGQPCNREMLTGMCPGTKKGAFSKEKTPEFAGAGDGI